MKDNNFKKFKYASCAMAIVMVVIITALVSFCTRIVKDEKFIDSTIQNVHKTINHVDSVWKEVDYDSTARNDSTQRVQ